MFDDAREMNLPETDKTDVLTKKDEAKKDEPKKDEAKEDEAKEEVSIEDNTYSWPLGKATAEKAVTGHWKLCLIAACGLTWYYQKRGKR